MPRSAVRDQATKWAKVTAHEAKEGKKQDGRFFPVVEGFDQIDKADIEGQKDIAKTAVSGWAEVPNTEISVKNISGAGRSATYMMTAPEGTNPRRLIMHNKNISTDEAEMANERRQERIVHEISKMGATPGRLAEGQTWYIEPCAGQDFHPADDGSDTEKVAKLCARFHKADVSWWAEYKKEVLPRYPGLEKFPNGDPVFYSVVNRDLEMIITDPASVEGCYTHRYEPISEAGKRVVTSHGDFHNGNMLRQEDGSLIAIDLECCYGAYACLDALYYLVQTHAKRDSYRKFAEVYLKESGLDNSEKSIGEFMFDIEMCKLITPLVGLNMCEGMYLVGSFTPNAEGVVNPYDMSIGAGVRRLLAKIPSEPQVGIDIVVEGLYPAMFKWADAEYKAAIEKWRNPFPYTNPEFYGEKDVCDVEFQTKLSQKELTEGLRTGQTMRTILDATGIPGMEFTTHDETHWEMNMAGNHIHGYNFKTEGNVFTWSMGQGSKIFAPYLMCKADASLTFEEGGKIHAVVGHVQQFYIGPSMLDDFIGGLGAVLEGMKAMWTSS